MPLSDRQQKLFETLAARATGGGFVAASFADIARESQVSQGSLPGHIYALECKDYLRCIDRGGHSHKSIYRVFPEGNARGSSAPYVGRPTGRSMGSANYSYEPWSAKRVERARAASRALLGIPEGHVRIYGVHVPEEFEFPLRNYASWMKGTRGIEAAISFVRKIEARGWKVRSPYGRLYKISDPGYVYKPRPSTVAKRRAWLLAAGVISNAWSRVYDIPVPEGYAKVIRPHAEKAAYRRGKTAGAWVVLEAARNGWPDMAAPVRGTVIDLELVEAMLSEHATVAEVAEFLSVTERYLKIKLKAYRAAANG